MATFWIITAAMALGAGLIIGQSILRGRRDTGPAEAFDIGVYRDQLKEVDRDLARGVIGPEDAERLRTEVSRRLLAADARRGSDADAPSAGRGGATTLALLLVVAVAGGAYALYWRLGAPGYGDLALADRIEMAREARETRPSQETAEASLPPQTSPEAPAEYLDLVERLRETVAARPGDRQGLTLLVRSEAALGNYRAAWEAQEKLLELKGDAATPSDQTDLADMMILAAGGYVSPEAEAILDGVLKRDPENGVARYYVGLMFTQTGRPDLAFRIWNRLLRESPADAPWREPILAQIEEIALRAGQEFTPPEDGLRGPTEADIAAAGEMSAEDRMAMIEGMVAQLSDRLASEGGSPEEWARLLTALGVLGDEAQAIAIWTEAQEVFAGNEDALATVRDGARRAGLVP